MSVFDWLLLSGAACILVLLALYFLQFRRASYWCEAWFREVGRRKAAEQSAEESRDEAGTFRTEAALLRGQLRDANARRCPRCQSARVGRFCAACGSAQLRPGTALARSADGKYRPAMTGDLPAGIVAGGWFPGWKIACETDTTWTLEPNGPPSASPQR